MENLLIWLRELSVATLCIRLVLAALCGGMIGFGRERQGRAAGLRTHVLVCLGAALTTLVGAFAVKTLGYDADPLRLGAQVVSGIGFLGVGTILITGKFQVTGLTTAAGLWATAAIGLAIGIGYYEGALLCTLLAVAATALLSRLERRLSQNPRRVLIYAELRGVDCVPAFRDYVMGRFAGCTLAVTSPRSAAPGFVGAELMLPVQEPLDMEELLRELDELDDVAYALEGQ